MNEELHKSLVDQIDDLQILVKTLEECVNKRGQEAFEANVEKNRWMRKHQVLEQKCAQLTMAEALKQKTNEDIE